MSRFENVPNKRNCNGGSRHTQTRNKILDPPNLQVPTSPATGVSLDKKKKYYFKQSSSYVHTINATLIRSYNNEKYNYKITQTYVFTRTSRRITCLRITTYIPIFKSQNNEFFFVHKIYTETRNCNVSNSVSCVIDNLKFGFLQLREEKKTHN